MVRHSVEQCTGEPDLRIFNQMSDQDTDRFYEGLTLRQEYVLAEVDRCIARYGAKSVLSL